MFAPTPRRRRALGTNAGERRRIIGDPVAIDPSGGVVRASISAPNGDRADHRPTQKAEIVLRAKAHQASSRNSHWPLPTVTQSSSRLDRQRQRYQPTPTRDLLERSPTTTPPAATTQINSAREAEPQAAPMRPVPAHGVFEGGVPVGGHRLSGLKRMQVPNNSVIDA
jgi:hypothetical protein